MIRLLATLLCSIALHEAAYADGYWLEVHGSGKRNDSVKIDIRYGGVNDSGHRYIKKGRDLDKMSGFKLYIIDPNGKRTDIPITQAADRWTGVFIPREKGIYRVLSIDKDLPIVIRPDSTQNIRPVQYLCTTYAVADISNLTNSSNLAHISSLTNSPQQFLDIIVLKGRQDSILISPYIDAKPVPGKTKIRIFQPDEKETAPVTDDRGRILLLMQKKGQYLIRLDWIDKTQTPNIRHRCDYTLMVP